MIITELDHSLNRESCDRKKPLEKCLDCLLYIKLKSIERARNEREENEKSKVMKEREREGILMYSRGATVKSDKCSHQIPSLSLSLSSLCPLFPPPLLGGGEREGMGEQ